MILWNLDKGYSEWGQTSLHENKLLGQPLSTKDKVAVSFICCNFATWHPPLVNSVHYHTNLQIIIIEIQRGQVGESPKVRAEVLDGTSDLHLCPVRLFPIFTILSRHQAVTSSQRLKGSVLAWIQPGHPESHTWCHLLLRSVSRVRISDYAGECYDNMGVICRKKKAVFDAEMLKILS